MLLDCFSGGESHIYGRFHDVVNGSPADDRERAIAEKSTSLQEEFQRIALISM